MYKCKTDGDVCAQTDRQKDKHVGRAYYLDFHHVPDDIPMLAWRATKTMFCSMTGVGAFDLQKVGTSKCWLPHLAMSCAGLLMNWADGIGCEVLTPANVPQTRYSHRHVPTHRRAHKHARSIHIINNRSLCYVNWINKVCWCFFKAQYHPHP